VVADPANDRTYLTFGMDYKPIPQVVVKADFTKADNAARTAQDQFNLGIGYNF
jgi:long-subunit fatty acid transport protein